jgi:hypothetical protein
VTAPAVGTLYDLPVVQDAVNYALQQLADWQLVPQRVAGDLAEVRRLAAAASDAGKPATVAQLAFLKQSLDGVQAEYTASTPLVASILNAARVVQGGGSLAPGTVVDAAKLTTTMAANLGALAQAERAIRDLGGNVTVGPSGGFHVPAWVQWGLIGLAAVWLVRRI